MGNEKKKVGPVVKANVETTTFISTVKQQLPKAQVKSEAPKSQPPALVDHKEMKKAGEASLGGNGKPPARPSDFTGKERQRYWEWVKFKTPIKIKLLNGEVFEGYLKWYDQYAVKLVTETGEIVIPKHSMLCTFDGPKPKPVV